MRVLRASRGLLLVLLLALALRLAWWLLYVDVIENEGVEYVRLAWNWFHGRGYVSIFGGTHTLFPPFYPLLIGFTTPLLGSGEMAARLVSLLGGLAVVGAGFLQARRVFGEKVAVLAGGGLAAHPLLIALSISTYSESLYLGLAMLGTLAAVRAVDDASWRSAVLAGICAGLAYLTRPEGIVLGAGFALLIFGALLLRRRDGSRAAGYALSAVTAAALVASPYVWHLSRIAGGFRWEGKSALNNRLALDVSRGMSYQEGSRGLTPDGSPRGVWMFSDQHAILAQPGAGTGGLLRTLLDDPIGRSRNIIGPFSSAIHLGAPLLLPLVIAGLLLTGWWKQRAPEGLALLVLPGVTLLVLFGVRWNWARYYFPLLGTGLIWAAAGAARLGALAAGLAQRIGLSGASARERVAVSLSGLLLLALVGQSARGLSSVGDLTQTRNPEARLVGELIRRDSGGESDGARAKIASLGLAVGHYAGGEVRYLPWAEEDAALKYLRRIATDYIVLQQSEMGNFPYARRWLETGISDSCAEPLRNTPPLTRYRVWRWRC